MTEIRKSWQQEKQEKLHSDPLEVYKRECLTATDYKQKGP